MGGPARDEVMKKRAGKAIRNPIHDKVMRKIPDRQGRLG